MIQGRHFQNGRRDLKQYRAVPIIKLSYNKLPRT